MHYNRQSSTIIHFELEQKACSKSSIVRHSQFFHQFLHSTFLSPCDPFPCPSSLPPTLSGFIICSFLEQVDYQKTSCHPLSSRKIHTFTSLPYGTEFCVHSFTRTLLVRLPVNYHNYYILLWPFDHLNDSW